MYNGNTPLHFNHKSTYMHSNLKYSLKHLKKKRGLSSTWWESNSPIRRHIGHIFQFPLSSRFPILSHLSWPHYNFSFLKPYSNSMMSPPLSLPLVLFFLFDFPSPFTSHTTSLGFPNSPGFAPAQAAIKKQAQISNSAWFPPTRNIMEINFVPKKKAESSNDGD